ncbi:hypothetical protein FRC03_003977 [Tulasnella sp. 419]|nr:hypothetical protein FRC03_003977 [Tulasnella sp. 419]
MSNAVRPATSAFASGMSSARVSKDSNLYEGLCKYLLRKRTLNLLYISIGVTHVILALLTIDLWGQGIRSILHLLRPTTIFLTITAFVLGVLPVLVFRKVSLTPRLDPKPTMAAQIRSLVTQLQAWRILAVYLGSSIALTIAFLYLAPQSGRFSVFKSTTLYPWHLNERFVFMVSSNLSVAALYAIGSLLNQRNVVRWPVTRETPISEVITNGIFEQIKSKLLFTLGVTGVFTPLYMIFRRAIFRFFVFIAKPFIYNFLRSRVWPITLSLIFRTVCLNVATVMVWFIAELIFDVYTSTPVSLSLYATNPTECLVAGITSKSEDGYYQGFALAELAELAKSSGNAAVNRRKTIFSDLKTPPSASAWSLICRETLIVLGKDYQTLLKRGTSAPAAPPTSAAPAAKTPITPRTPSAVKRTSIYAAPPGTPADKLLDNISGYLALADDAMDQTTKKLPMPSLFSSTAAPSKPSSQSSSALIPSAGSVATQLYDGANRVLPTQVMLMVDLEEKVYKAAGSALFKTRTKNVVEMALPNMVVDMWAIDALCHFAANSFTEDPYGLVQRDIPRILEAMLAFQQALEAFKKEWHHL